MYVEYRASNGANLRSRDLLETADKEGGDGNVDTLIKSLGYLNGFEIGNPDVASVQLFTRWDEKAEYAALAIVILGETVDIYAFPTTEDAWHYLHATVPTIKSLAELSIMKFA